MLGLILAVGVLDQSTKYLVTRFMEFGESIPAEGFIRLTYVVNPGAAFGLFQGQSMLLTVGSFLGIGVLVLFYYRAPFPGALLRLSLGLQLGARWATCWTACAWARSSTSSTWGRGPSSTWPTPPSSWASGC